MARIDYPLAAGVGEVTIAFARLDWIASATLRTMANDPLNPQAPEVKRVLGAAQTKRLLEQLANTPRIGELDADLPRILRELTATYGVLSEERNAVVHGLVLGSGGSGFTISGTRGTATSEPTSEADLRQLADRATTCMERMVSVTAWFIRAVFPEDAAAAPAGTELIAHGPGIGYNIYRGIGDQAQASRE